MTILVYVNIQPVRRSGSRDSGFSNLKELLISVKCHSSPGSRAGSGVVALPAGPGLLPDGAPGGGAMPVSAICSFFYSDYVAAIDTW